jgi:hypothetical protein
MPEEEIHEKWHKDPLGGVVFGLILIVVAGIYLFRGYLPSEPWWGWAAIGVGCVFLLEALARSVRPEYRRPTLGRAVWAVILIALGVGFIYGFEDFWPIVIIAVGIVILLYYIRQSI